MDCRENEGFEKMRKSEQWENERAIFKDDLFRMICWVFTLRLE